MELSNRLHAVADLLTPGRCVADIGCDHGYIGIYLVTKGSFSSCIAMDVNQGPLDRARIHVQEKQLSTYIDLRLSDGAAALRRGEADAAVLAGMGGRLTIKILTEGLDKFRDMKEIVLQPQSEIAKVRRFLRETGFVILQEDMVREEGKFYPMMKVAGRGEPINCEADTEVEDHFGPCLLRHRHPVLKEFLDKEEVLYGNLQRELEETIAEKEKKDGKAPGRKAAEAGAISGIEAAAERLKERLSLIRQGQRWYDDEM